MADNTDLGRLLVLIVAIVILFPVLMMVVAWPLMGLWGGGHMWNGGMWSGTGAPWIWLVMWLIPLLVLLSGGYVLYRFLSNPDGDKGDAALEELRLTYARGELSEEEFQTRREQLRRDEET